MLLLKLLYTMLFSINVDITLQSLVGGADALRDIIVLWADVKLKKIGGRFLGKGRV